LGDRVLDSRLAGAAPSLFARRIDFFKSSLDFLNLIGYNCFVK